MSLNFAVSICLASLLLLHASSGSAFCIYNFQSNTITAIQIPASPGSYIGVVGGGSTDSPSKDCCNWMDCGQYSAQTGRCDVAFFCMLPGDQQSYGGFLQSQKIVEAVTDVIGTAASEVTAGGSEAGAAIVNAALEAAGAECGTTIASFNGGIAGCDQNGNFFGAWDGENQKPPDGTC